MTTPAIQKYVDYDTVPMPSNHAWYQSKLVRRVGLAATSILMVGAGAATHWAYYNFTATPATIIWTVRTLAGFTTAMTLSTLVNLLIPTSEKDPTYRANARKNAQALLEPANAPIMEYPEMQRRFGRLFETGVLVNADVCALMRKECEVHNLPFGDIAQKHTHEVLDRLEDDPATKQLLANKYLGEARLTGNLSELMSNVWVKGLGIKKWDLAPRVLKENADLIMNHLGFADFEQQYGLDVVKYAPENVRRVLFSKLTGHILKLSVNEYKHKYETFVKENFGEEQNTRLTGIVVDNRITQLLAGQVESFQSFRINNGYDTLVQAANNPAVKTKLKELYLKMEAKVLLSDVYAEDRKLLEITPEDCIEALNDWVEGRVYPDFKLVIGFKYFEKLSEPIKERCKREIFYFLVGSPTMQAEYAEEMQKFGYTNDMIYMARWKDRGFWDIVGLDGVEFPKLLKDPRLIKEKCLQGTVNSQLTRLIQECPALFRHVFAPQDQASPSAKTIQKRLQEEVTDYLGLTSIAHNYGEGFYTSGYLSDQHMEKLVAKFLFEQTHLLLERDFKLDPPLSTAFAALVGTTRQKAASIEAQLKKDLETLDVKHNAAVKQIREDATANLNDSSEKRELQNAEKAKNEADTALQKSTDELQALRTELNELRSKEVWYDLRDQQTLLRQRREWLKQTHAAPLEELNIEVARLEQKITEAEVELKTKEAQYQQQLKDNPEFLKKTRELAEYDIQLSIVQKQKEREALYRGLSDPELLVDPTKKVQGYAAAQAAEGDLKIRIPKIKALDEELKALKEKANPELASLDEATLTKRRKDAEQVPGTMVAPNFAPLKDTLEGHRKHLEAVNSLKRGYTEMDQLSKEIEDLTKTDAEWRKRNNDAQLRQTSWTKIHDANTRAQENALKQLNEAKAAYNNFCERKAAEVTQAIAAKQQLFERDQVSITQLAYTARDTLLTEFKTALEPMIR